MSDKPLKCKYRWLWVITILAIVVWAAALLVQWWFPVYLESRLLPEIVGKFGLTAQRIDIRRIGLNGADLGSVILNRDGRPCVELAAIHLDYSPLALVNGEIGGLTINSLHMTAIAHTNGVTIAGFDLFSSQPTPALDADKPRSLESILPIGIGHVRIHNAVIDLYWKDIRIPVPIDVDLDTGQLSQDRLSATATLYPRGNPVVVHITLDLAANSVGVILEKAHMRMESMADILELLTPITATGTLLAKGEIQATLTPFAFKAVETSGHLTRVRIQSPHMIVGNVPDSSGRVLPMQFEARLQAADTIDWSCGPLWITGPATATLEQFKGQLSKRSGLWEWSASSSVTIDDQTLSLSHLHPLVLEEKQMYVLGIEARQLQSRDVDFDITAQPREPGAILEASITGHRVSAKVTDIAIKGRYNSHTLESKVGISLTQLAAPLPGGRFQCPQLNVTTEITADGIRDQPRLELHTTLVANHIQATDGSLKASVPEIKLKTRISKEVDRPLAMKGDLKLGHARIQDVQKGLTVDDMRLHLPIQWPLSNPGILGSLRIATVQYRNRSLGGLTGSLFQTGPGVAIKAEHHSKLFGGLIVSIHAAADVNGATLDFSVPAYTLPAGMDVGQVFPEVAGYRVNGTIQARGRLEMKPSGLKGTATASLENGEVREEESGLHLSGIQGNFSMEDLIRLRSGPGQRLMVDSLQFGNIKAAELQIDFQLEPAATLLVERARMKWSKGMVTTNALRVRPEENQYDLTLICDRLNLAMVLEQLGAAQGSGEGAVNGVIPLRWSQEGLHVDKGFLYSTPGQTGTIRLQGTELLLTGLPPGSPQHTQLDIATEALKDYTYNWAKLNLESDDDLLKIMLQLDGKPNRLLPFGYDQNLGRLKRVEGKGQAEFKGISVDLNFNIPFNKILKYRESI